MGYKTTVWFHFVISILSAALIEPLFRDEPDPILVRLSAIMVFLLVRFLEMEPKEKDND